MNQSIKAKILPLFPILDLNELRQETHLEDAVLSDFSVGWDQNVYLLFKQMAESQDKITAKTPRWLHSSGVKNGLGRRRNSGHSSISTGASKIPVSLYAGHW